MKNIEHLRDVIRSLHDVEATHIASVPVTGLFRGRTVWEGTVEVFQLTVTLKPHTFTRGRTIRTIPRTQSGMSPYCILAQSPRPRRLYRHRSCRG